MRDEINSTPMSDQESLIINIDHSSNDGTHWTCLSTENNTCVYFDSFGLPPPTEVVTYCNALAVTRSYSSRSSISSSGDISGGSGGSSSSCSSGSSSSSSCGGRNKPLLRLYSTFPLQKLHEVICGHLCIFMLYRLGNGDDFSTVLDTLYDYRNN